MRSIHLDRLRKLAAAALALCFLAFQPLFAAPKIDAVRAAQIATEYLRKLGPDAPYIESVSLENSALLKSEESWVVHWSKSIAIGENSVFGLRVKMDGSVAQLAIDKEARRKRAMARSR